MSDIFKRRKRSQVMTRIRGAGNKATELRLIALLRSHRLTGWRRDSTLPGRPDFVFSRAKLAVFVDGCFWHSCPLHSTRPKPHAAFCSIRLLASLRGPSAWIRLRPGRCRGAGAIRMGAPASGMVAEWQF